jgi:peptidoglycan/LPS O-acetylase OafA/YrhL
VNVQNPRFPLFDALRGLAALAIITVHTAFIPGGIGENATVGKYLAQLTVALPVFFLISGFLLYRPFVAARFAGERLATGPYAIRRFFRIVPAYWAALPLIAIWLEKPAILHDPLPYFGFAQVYSKSTLIHGHQIAWSLCIEVTFYALLPVWAFALSRLPGRSRRQLVTTELGLLVAVFAASFVWNAIQTPDHLGFVRSDPAVSTLPAYLDQLALGMSLAVASVALADRARQPRAVTVIERAPWVPWLLAAVAWIGLCNLGPVHTAWAEVVRHEVGGVVAFFLLLPAVFGDDRGGAVRRLLADRRVQWIGVISYSLYIWHTAVIDKLDRAGWDGRLGRAGFVLVAFAASFAIAAVSFYLVERPGLRIGRRLSGRRGYQEVASPEPETVDRPGAPAIELAGAERQRP